MCTLIFTHTHTHTRTHTSINIYVLRFYTAYFINSENLGDDATSLGREKYFPGSRQLKNSTNYSSSATENTVFLS